MNLTSHVLAVPSKGDDCNRPKRCQQYTSDVGKKKLQNSSRNQTHSQSNHINSIRPKMFASHTKVPRIDKGKTQLGLNEGVLNPSMLIG